LIACFGQGLCQTALTPVRQRLPDAEVYESFFWQVAEFRVGDTFYPPLPAQPIVLTEQERQALGVLATDCGSKIRALKAAISSLRLELLYQSIESGQVPEVLAQQLENLQKQHTQIVFDQMGKLKAAFGVIRFQMVEAFIRSWEPESGSPFASPLPSFVPHPIPQNDPKR
jgi:hypothetical protein